VLGPVLGTDPVLGVVVYRVERDHVPLNEDHAVAVQRVAGTVIRHVAEVNDRPIVLSATQQDRRDGLN